MGSASISVLVLTYNEEANLSYLLESLVGWVSGIFIVDSGSTDRTLDIARRYGAHIVYHPWETYAEQFNWGLQHLPFDTDWVMRMDADELVTPELAQELMEKLPKLQTHVTGLYVKRRVYFMGRWIRHGSYYPTWLLRVFRHGKALCEDLWMDEHMVLTEGEVQHLTYDIIDYNRKGLSFWTLKHDNYAQREMLDLLNVPQKEKPHVVSASILGPQDRRKRWLKSSLYARAPLFWRALAYFLYRYFLRFGFLDGTEGLIFHVLQAFWYRFYVDAKIWEHYHLRMENEA